MKHDVLIFTAKPGDASIGMGGTIVRFISAKLSVRVIDLIESGLNSVNDIKELQFEISEANKILGLQHRENIGLFEDELNLDRALVKTVVKKIREYKPDLIFAPFKMEKDPISADLGKIVNAAFNLSGKTDYNTIVDDNVQDPHSPKKIFYFFLEADPDPSFIVDVSDVFEIKMDAVKTYVSRFSKMEKENGGSAKNYFEFLEARGKIFGYKINKKFGEPFYTEDKLEFDVVNFLQSSKGIGWK